MFENFFYGEMPKASNLKELLLQMVIGGMADDGENYDAHELGRVVCKLLSAYWILLELENEDRYDREMEAACDGGQEALDLFHRVYRKAFVQEWAVKRTKSKYGHLLRTETEDEVDTSHLELDVLGAYDNGYVNEKFPKWLISNAAKARANRDCRFRIGMTEWDINSDIPGTKEYREFVKMCGKETADKHAQEISGLLAAEVENG